jgi:subtilisin family serine protease
LRLPALPRTAPRALIPRLLVAIVLATAPSVASAQVLQLPPEVQLLMRRDIDRRTVEAMADFGDPSRPSAGEFAAITAAPDGRYLIDVFLRATPGAESAIAALGGVTGTRAAGWVTARIPIDELQRVAALPGVSSIEVARRARLVTDSAMRDIGVTSNLRQRTQDDHFQGSTGRGAIIGVIDTGIDFMHPDFREDDTGRSRVAFLWDQTRAGAGPAPVGGANFSYGVECTRVQMATRDGCASRDTDGHGTHVAGLAAGDGSGAIRGQSVFSYTGVAPGADLIIVKTDLSFASIVDGIDYVFKRAAQLGRPAVVNLSLSTQLGPHDGNEASSLMIDALSGPGRVVVAAAGNEGNQNPLVGEALGKHAEVSPAVGDSGSITLRITPYVPRSGSGNDIVLVQTFYSPADTFDVTVVRPDGSRMTVAFGDALSSSNAAGGVVGYNGTIRGDTVLGPSLEIGSFAPASPSHTASFYLGEWFAGAAAPAPGNWRLIFHRVGGTADGLVDAYVPFVEIFADVSFTTGATNRRLVGAPGGARNAITVGAYATRLAWPSADGNQYRYSGDSLPIGALLPFSSPGPTRDGRLKPEITAPGRVMSSLSRDASFPIQLIAPDSAHAMLEGTSMATPIVAGAVALLLAERPTLTHSQVLAALAGSARQDAFTAQLPMYGDLPPGPDDPAHAWGYGKLNVPGALAAVTRVAGRGIASPVALDSSVERSERGTIVPLQSIRIAATDPESLSVIRVRAAVIGSDAAFQLGVAVDANRDGALSDGETVVALGDAVVLAGSGVFEVVIPTGALVIPRGGTADLLLVGKLSGAVPSGTTFSAELDLAGSHTIGLRTGTTTSLGGESGAGARVLTTVLSQGERFTISQNPVRFAPLILSVGEPVRRFEILDFTGRMVRSIIPLESDRSIRWDLTNEGGTLVANGTYLMILELESGLVRQRLFITR